MVTKASKVITQVRSRALPDLLAPFGGGYYVGLIRYEDVLRAIITAPKAEGETTGIYGDMNDKDIKAASFYDSLTNTKAMAKAGSKLATWALGLRIAGAKDWCIPARDPLELLYRHGKPTKETNWVNRNGDNPSSYPVGYPYSPNFPKQVAKKLFRAGGNEAFEEARYWSSTRYSAGYAWSQRFGDGSQGWHGKLLEFRCRAIRTVPVIN